MAAFLDNFLTRLPHKARKHGKEWRTLCPAHDDRSPSLDLSEGRGGQVVTRCRSQNCAFLAIARAWGIPPRDFFPADAGVYDYGNRKRHIHKLRSEIFDPVAGRWRVGKEGEWQAIPDCLYNVAEVEAAALDVPIYFVEGGKDVETLRREGHVATTTGGADSWKAELAEKLRGRDVVFLPDNDGPGRRYRDAVMRDVAPISRSFRVVELPDLREGGDVTDWLNAGGTPEQLDRLVAEAPDLKPAAELEVARLSPLYVARLPKPRPRTWILERWIPEFHTTYIFGPGGVFKSWLVLLLSLSICMGKLFSNLPTASGGVLWLDWELDIDEFGRRVRALVRGLGLDDNEIPTNLAYLSLTESIRDNELQTRIRALIESLAPRLVVIDSYSAACSGGDSNSNDDVAQVMAILRRLGCTVLVIDHTTKTAMSEKQLEATALGGVTKWNLSRSSIVIGSNGGGVMMRHRKTNFGPLMDPLAFQFSFHEDPGTKEETVWVRQTAIDAPELETLESQLPAAIRIPTLLKREAGPLTVDEIVELLDGVIPKKTVQNTLSILKGKNKVVPGSDGRWSLQTPDPPYFKGSGVGSPTGLPSTPEVGSPLPT